MEEKLLPLRVIRLVEVQFGLDPPFAGKIDLGESPCRITEHELLVKGLAVHLIKIGPGLDAQMKTLRLSMQAGYNEAQ